MVKLIHFGLVSQMSRLATILIHVQITNQLIGYRVCVWPLWGIGAMYLPMTIWGEYGVINGPELSGVPGTSFVSVQVAWKRNNRAECFFQSHDSNYSELQDKSALQERCDK